MLTNHCKACGYASTTTAISASFAAIDDKGMISDNFVPALACGKCLTYCAITSCTVRSCKCRDTVATFRFLLSQTAVR